VARPRQRPPALRPAPLSAGLSRRRSAIGAGLSLSARLLRERSWSFGDYLPGGWYGSSYYLNAWQYGLPYPPIGCEWVRVGNDALLVDVWSGQVLSVYYGLFW
jgi:Ni/Co efflux regulator RcnB